MRWGVGMRWGQGDAPDTWRGNSWPTLPPSGFTVSTLSLLCALFLSSLPYLSRWVVTVLNADSISVLDLRGEALCMQSSQEAFVSEAPGMLG